MKWWNGIWLNEAFATFMEMKATDAFRPDWQRWVDFGLSRSVAFDTDTLVATRPIEFPVVSPADADGMFDVLTYEKGASVVRMLEQYLGEEGFRGGLRRYMARHQLGNTETTDLWDALEEETGEPVRRIADSWIFQGGYPGVAVELVDGAGASGASVVRLSQHRFMFSPADHGERWAVPLVVGARTNGDTAVHRVLLDADVSELTLSSPAEWINANLGANGFYRVAYSDDLRARLVARRADLSPLERYVLVDDTLAGVLAGVVEASAFLDLADHFSDEMDLSVWERLVGGLATLDRVLDDGPDRDAYALHVRSLLAPVRARLGDDVRPDDDDRTRTLRGLLVGSAATLGDDPDALALCRARLDAYLADASSIDPSLAAAALSASATHGDVALHDRLLGAFRSASNPQDRERLLFSLARFRDAAALQRTLDLALGGEVRTQDAPYLLRETIANRDNGATAWRFVTSRWDELLAKFPHNSLSRMVSGIRTIRDPALATEVTTFLDAHPVPTGELQVRQHIERMQVTVALAARESSRLAATLTS
jgi:puromycin-sensitive aminopeptidase